MRINARNSRRAHPVHDALLDVVLDGIRPGAVGAPVVDERRLDVEHVDHRGRDGDDATVGRRRGPRRPPALRGAGHDEPGDRLAATLGACGKRSHRVHGANSALRHRQASRPFLIAGTQELVPGVGDEVVFRPRCARGIVLEDHRLIRDETQLGRHRSRVARRIDEPGRRTRGRRTVVAPAADEQQADVARDVPAFAAKRLRRGLAGARR